MAAKLFRFSLEALLRVRHIKEQQALGSLAKVLASYNVHQKEIISKRQEIQASMQDYTERSKEAKGSEESSNALSASTIESKQIWDQYFRRLDRQIEESQSKAQVLRPELERERNKVQAVRRERRVLELLKEKEKAEYLRKMQRKERKELAELNRRTQSLNRSHDLKF